MAKFRFHKIAAIVVLAVSAAWVLTGEFSSVNSAADSGDETAAQPAETGTPVAGPPVLRTVGVVEPYFVDHSRAVRISGLTEADKRATLATRAAGVIETLPFEQGDSVAEGDVILSLEVEEETAMIDTARAILDQREKEYKATELLVENGTLPKLRADEALSALTSARSQLQQAEAEHGRLQVRAPFPGVIDRLMVEKGSSVQSGAQVAVLLKLDPVIARGEVSESDLHYIKLGNAAEIRLVNGRKVQGTVNYISRDASPQTRTFPVEIAVRNADLSIPAGMTAEITLRAETVRAVVLPRSVVTLSGNGDLGIRILSSDDTAAFVPIDLIDDMPRGLVLGGVPADARIIVAGQDLVVEGEKVNPVEADKEVVQRLIGEATGKAN
ncbi:MAG: efflux RND transporter periplasmic adaptor subunit [Hyphomicrobiales bacterium]|nr:efflux RND transporter periplasmic adaptor subunit [Hyphomicrobiales bacterium]